MERANYIVTLLEDIYGDYMVRYIHHNKETVEAEREMVLQIKNLSGARASSLLCLNSKTMKWVWLNDDGEYVKHVFNSWLSESEAVHKVATAYLAESNRQPEEENSTLANMGKIILLDMKYASNSLCAQDASATFYIQNYFVTGSCSKDSKLFEMRHWKRLHIWQSKKFVRLLYTSQRQYKYKSWCKIKIGDAGWLMVTARAVRTGHCCRGPVRLQRRGMWALSKNVQQACLLRSLTPEPADFDMEDLIMMPDDLQFSPSTNETKEAEMGIGSGN